MLPSKLDRWVSRRFGTATFVVTITLMGLYIIGDLAQHMDEGFIDRARGPSYEVIPDYVFPGVDDENTATILAGIVGTLIVFGLSYGLAWALRQRSGQAAP